MVKWEVNESNNNEETIAIRIVKMLLLESIGKYKSFKRKKKFC